ncbi:TauD/TfdA family dioxygenase [Saccharospirillum impatiens]|uniref:TauD/TfdA family dioxygenase n=1 Tax=Saccharospirillum impatiens TaxID=169438 RepID=UPI00040E3BC2|nr:TauD/TfdA family dioxygenase [Saccharospirillum impatiens]
MKTKFNAEEVISKIATDGLCQIRNSDLSAEDFNELTNILSDQNLVHGSEREKITEDDSVQEVTKGNDWVPPHMEMGRMPVQPDIAAFFCEKPAELGGETIVVDGKAVFESLPNDVIEYFSRNKIKYTATMDLPYWSRAWGCETMDDVRKLVMAKFSDPSLSFSFLDNMCVDASFSTSAFKHKKDGSIHFTNSIYGPYEGGGGGRLTDENNFKITQNLLDAISNVYLDLEQVVPLSAGDMVIMDNKRFMHGRNKFSGSNRRIYAKFFNIECIGALYED